MASVIQGPLNQFKPESTVDEPPFSPWATCFGSSNSLVKVEGPSCSSGEPEDGHRFHPGTLDALKVKLAGHSKTIQLGLLRVVGQFFFENGEAKSMISRIF